MLWEERYLELVVVVIVAEAVVVVGTVSVHHYWVCRDLRAPIEDNPRDKDRLLMQEEHHPLLEVFVTND